MISRLNAAVRKLLFCYRIAADIASFMKIIIQTKISRRNRNAGSLVPRVYHFNWKRRCRDVYLRTRAGDIDIFYEVFWKKVYAVPDLQTSTVCTVVDLGANVGLASLFFSQMFPGANIYSVEPDPDNFSCLKANLQQEISSGRLLPLQAGITAEDGYAFIAKKEKAYNTNISTTDNSGVAVRILCMNTLIRELQLNRIDLLKIDIEGWEDPLLATDTGWLQIVHHIIMECHSPDIRQRCESALHAHGFITGTTEHQLLRAWRKQGVPDTSFTGARPVV